MKMALYLRVKVKNDFIGGRARLSIQGEGFHYREVNNFPIPKELDIITYSMKMQT